MQALILQPAGTGKCSDVNNPTLTAEAFSSRYMYLLEDGKYIRRWINPVRSIAGCIFPPPTLRIESLKPLFPGCQTLLAIQILGME